MGRDGAIYSRMVRVRADLHWAGAPGKARRQEVGLGSGMGVDFESPDGPLARDDGGVMTNDPRGCDGSKPSRKGSRGAVASHSIHSTSPFEAPRNRPAVAFSPADRPGW